MSYFSLGIPYMTDLAHLSLNAFVHHCLFLQFILSITILWCWNLIKKRYVFSIIPTFNAKSRNFCRAPYRGYILPLSKNRRPNATLLRSSFCPNRCVWVWYRLRRFGCHVVMILCGWLSYLCVVFYVQVRQESDYTSVVGGTGYVSWSPFNRIPFDMLAKFSHRGVFVFKVKTLNSFERRCSLAGA